MPRGRERVFLKSVSHIREESLEVRVSKEST